MNRENSQKATDYSLDGRDINPDLLKWGKSGRRVKLTTRLYLVLSSEICEFVTSISTSKH